MQTNSLAKMITNAQLLFRYPRASASFLAELNYLPRIAFPQTYNDKMFWRRAFDHNPAFALFADKIATKHFLSKWSPRLNLAETLWVGTDPAKLPAHLARAGVLLKQSNASSRTLDLGESGWGSAQAEYIRKNWLQRPYKPWNAEWGYGQSKPRLLAERRIEQKDCKLLDLKFHIFSGKVYYVVVYVDEKQPYSKSAIFSPEGDRLAVTNSVVARDRSRALPADFRLPASFLSAVQIASEIASGFDYLRVDLMSLDDQLFGGEITPYPTGGRMTNSSPQVLRDMGNSWDLRQSWFVQTEQQPASTERYRQALIDHLEGKSRDKPEA
jgi:hypothetical protein